MGELRGYATIELRVEIVLTEAEVNALDALTGYSDDAFLKVFYAHLGEHYLRPHEKGLRSLFNSVRSQLGGILDRTRNARLVFKGERVAIDKPPAG